MPLWVQNFCLILFMVIMLVPSLYGLHYYLMTVLALRTLRGARARQRRIIAEFRASTPDERWPFVTTQLPMYNELAVARRVLEAAAAMEYPRGRHEIQVLDDSTDSTRHVVDQVVGELRTRGCDIRVIRRPTRAHYKAGALAHGISRTRGEFLAVFDADFIPDRGFLRRMIPLIAAQPDVGCAQARWGHINANESWMTRAIALGLDVHFGVEQGARCWNGFLLNFNGTGGIWRRAAIDDPRVGGWDGDTLTEDLDLSYRAQMQGWRVEYTIDEVCPAEVPADIDAVKSQQRRWATGSIQTACKLLPMVWRAKLTLLQKLEATVHLTQYSVAIAMVLMAAFGRTLLLPVAAEKAGPWLAATSWLILLATSAPVVAYVAARWALGEKLPNLWRIAQLMLLGMGLSLNNALAALVGFVQRGGEFVRTPKSGSRGPERNGRVMSQSISPYAALRSRLWMMEIALGVVCFAQWAAFLERDHYIGGTFLLLYAIGLGYLGWASRPQRRRRAPRTAPVRVESPYDALPAAAGTTSPESAPVATMNA